MSYTNVLSHLHLLPRNFEQNLQLPVVGKTEVQRNHQRPPLAGFIGLFVAALLASAFWGLLITFVYLRR